MALRPLNPQLAAAALILGTVAAVLVPASSVEAQAACSQLALTGTGGSNSLLGQFFEFGLRCTPGYPLQLVVGGRWSEQHPTANAFGLLSYSTTLSQVWSVTVVGSYRERLGDYEGHRAPEAFLRYVGAGNGWIPSLELSVGSTQIVQPSVGATRLGGVLGLQSPVGRLAPGLEAVASARVGAYSYDVGATQSFYGGSLEITRRLGDDSRLVLSYTQQGGSGSSPLLYDLVGFEQVLTGRFSWFVSPRTTAFVSAAVNLHTPTVTGREYVLQFDSTAGWYLGAIYRASDGRFFINFGF